MRAQVLQTTASQPHPTPVTLICNELKPVWVQHRFASKKYKKVAKKFNINYSTAKSIAQNHKKKRALHSEYKLTSTDECDSPSPSP